MSDKIFLINKLNSNLMLKGGYIELEPNGHIAIRISDKEEDSIKYAEDRDWIEFSDTKPSASVKKSEIEATVTEPYKGMTEAELKQSKVNETIAETATSTALGRGPSVIELIEPVTQETDSVKKTTKAK